MKNIKKYALLILLVVGAFVCLNGFTYAKYISSSIWEYYLKSMGFYFNSDHLGVAAVKNVDNQWDGETVHFNLRNNLNETVITNSDISYNAVCTLDETASKHAVCHLNGTESNTEEGIITSFVCINNTLDGIDVSEYNEEECDAGSYDWKNQISIKDLYFDVVLTDPGYELTDVVVNITVTSTSPYEKVLSGDFTLHKNNIVEDIVNMNYKHYSNYDRLIVSNSYTSAKCVSITWNANNLRIDANSNQFSAYNVDLNGYINEIKFNINAKDSISYTFYRNDFDETYDASAFSIEEAEGC